MRLHRHARAKLLREVPLFADCSDKELRDIADLADEIDFARGDELMRRGHRGNLFMVIVEGAAEVQAGDEPRTLGPGDFLGEIALLTGTPRTATVVATTQVQVLALAEPAFDKVLHDVPSVSEKVSREAYDRLRG